MFYSRAQNKNFLADQDKYNAMPGLRKELKILKREKKKKKKLSRADHQTT